MENNKQDIKIIIKECFELFLFPIFKKKYQ